MEQRDPFEFLGLMPGAGLDEIEEAYDRLFDKYEPEAVGGDSEAIAFLDRLNRARDALIGVNAPVGTGDRSRPREDKLPQRTQERAEGRTGARQLPDQGAARVKRRSSRPRSVTTVPQRSLTPYILIGVVSLITLAALFFMLTRNGPAPSTGRVGSGKVVATVNGSPIFDSEWKDRIARDKATALSDPLYGPLINNFEGITGTRMLDVLSYDALDKLVNLEVIQQQARKEGLYPTPAQAQGLIADAKTRDLKAGQSFDSFLKSKGISEAQYNQTVVQNVVYSVAANEHLPKKGTAEQRTEGFIKWICDARKNYEVKLLVQFAVKENQPCTSGLPTDLALPGLNQTAPPNAEPTSPVKVTPVP